MEACLQYDHKLRHYQHPQPSRLCGYGKRRRLSIATRACTVITRVVTNEPDSVINVLALQDPSWDHQVNNDRCPKTTTRPHLSEAPQWPADWCIYVYSWWIITWSLFRSCRSPLYSLVVNVSPVLNVLPRSSRGLRRCEWFNTASQGADRLMLESCTTNLREACFRGVVT